MSTDSTVTTTSTEQDLALILRAEMQDFIDQKLYDEALSCIQNIFELNQSDDDLLYSYAEIYYLKQDYISAFNWLRSYANVHPRDYRAYLLNIKIQLRQGNKDEALYVLNNLFTQNITLPDETAYENLDKVIERLKKVFKADKLARRCPAIATYERERRQMKKNRQTVSPSSSATIEPPITLSSKEAITQPETAENHAMSPETIPLPEMEPPLEKLPDTQQPDTIAETPEISPATEEQLSISGDNEANATALIESIWSKQRAGETEINTIVMLEPTIIDVAIKAQLLSLTKKLWLYNYVADIYRQHNKLTSAIYLLRQALLIDDENDLLLKNLGYTLYLNHEYAAALVTFEDILHKDFSVYDFIKQCRQA